MSTITRFHVYLGDLLRPGEEGAPQLAREQWPALAQRIRTSEWAEWRQDQVFSDETEDLQFLLEELVLADSSDDAQVALDQIQDLAHEDGCWLET
jgi:hypothetical protein